MSKTYVELIKGYLNLHSDSNKENAIAIHKRYREVKENYAEEYLTVILPYRRMVRRKLSEELTNPLMIAAQIIELLKLDSDQEKISADLILCAALDVGFEISRGEMAEKIYQRGNLLHSVD